MVVKRFEVICQFNLGQITDLRHLKPTRVFHIKRVDFQFFPFIRINCVENLQFSLTLDKYLIYAIFTNIKK